MCGGESHKCTDSSAALNTLFVALKRFVCEGDVGAGFVAEKQLELKHSLDIGTVYDDNCYSKCTN